jgi:hypothetical protein
VEVATLKSGENMVAGCKRKGKRKGGGVIFIARVLLVEFL